MTTITIRNVPDDVRDELAARAAREGRSLQEHLRGALITMASKPTNAEVLARIRSRKEATGGRVTADQILAHLDAVRGKEPDDG
ncbi:hypothetical protein WCD74_09810 [Actinomycetospora sp. OC33-EN08]|uniref:Antitoxin FitA-like ribbon-helix-helix domain-containing protein n=1 Tax=Actinomycetospora aurantiaca TaxID=3129233 RepID=A0ABU8ML77_9PSEU